jgi:hypothetical protein
VSVTVTEESDICSVAVIRGSYGELPYCPYNLATRASAPSTTSAASANGSQRRARRGARRRPYRPGGNTGAAGVLVNCVSSSRKLSYPCARMVGFHDVR